MDPPEKRGRWDPDRESSASSDSENSENGDGMMTAASQPDLGHWIPDLDCGDTSEQSLNVDIRDLGLSGCDGSSELFNTDLVSQDRQHFMLPIANLDVGQSHSGSFQESSNAKQSGRAVQPDAISPPRERNTDGECSTSITYDRPFIIPDSVTQDQSHAKTDMSRHPSSSVEIPHESEFMDQVFEGTQSVETPVAMSVQAEVRTFDDALFVTSQFPVVDDSDDQEDFLSTVSSVEDLEADSDTETTGHDVDGGIIPPQQEDPLYLGAPITVEESVLSIFSFIQSENLSGAGAAKLLKLVELHCPKPNHCVSSLYNLFHQFEHVKTPLQSYFYCNQCLKVRTSLTDICDECKLLKPSVDQVVVLSLVEQLTQLYARSEFIEDIQYRFKRVKMNPNNLEDIFDGSVYKKAMQDLSSEKYNISFMWNTDGVCLYDSSKLQLWPLYLVINELPPEKRFKRENLILVAVYIGESKPNVNVYLKHVYPLVDQLREGISVSVAGEEDPVVVKCCIICGTCDSPAKAMMFNMKLFNGFFSCPMCLSKGEKSERSDDVFVHPYEEDAILRTDESYEEDAILSCVSNINVAKSARIASHGVKGPSYLYLMVPQMICSTSVDTMHFLYLGIMRQLLQLWFDKSHKDEEYSLYKIVKVVSTLLVSIRPPHFVKRLPRSLQNSANYKAFELLMLLYYYLLPVLQGQMKQIYFHNFKLLIAGVSLLNKQSVSFADIEEAEVLVKQFVKDFQELFGFRNMSFNVHLILHLPSTVKALGPACLTTCFRFEDLNGKLRNMIHGSRYAGSQLSSNLFSFLNLPKVVHDLKSENVKKFCTNVHKNWKRVRIIELIFEKCYSVGRYCKVENIAPWLDELLMHTNYESLFSFHRIKLRGILITSENYHKSKCSISHYVQYCTNGINKYGSIRGFVKITKCTCTEKCSCPGQYFAIVTQYSNENCFTTANPPHSIQHIQKCAKTETIEAVPISSISNVCICIKIDESLYLCTPLNEMEMYN
ncbi:hypothetical protein FOCC_FOCC015657 [Frankliniella occidentalis]|nr:hypothetical protein FOCC_FOCC015657 [Frankliniella occidentalis]